MIIICSSNILIINMIYYYDLEQNNIYIYTVYIYIYIYIYIYYLAFISSCDTSLYF